MAGDDATLGSAAFCGEVREAPRAEVAEQGAPDLLRLALRTYDHSSTGRLKSWWQEVVRNASESIEEKIQRQLTEEPFATSRAIVQGSRAALGAIGSRSLPFIASLTRDYACGLRQPDQFFGGLMSVLCTLDDGELVALEQLVDILSQWATHHDLHIARFCARPHIGSLDLSQPGTHVPLFWWPPGRDSPAEDVLVGELSHSIRIFRCLAVNQLSWDTDAPNTLVIERSAIARLRQYVI